MELTAIIPPTILLPEGRQHGVGLFCTDWSHLVPGNRKTTQPILEDTCLGEVGRQLAGRTAQCTSCSGPWLLCWITAPAEGGMLVTSWLACWNALRVWGQRLHSKKTHGTLSTILKPNTSLKGRGLIREALALLEELVEMQIHRPDVLTQNQGRRGKGSCAEVLKMILKVWEQVMQKKLKADWPCISGLCM